MRLLDGATTLGVLMVLLKAGDLILRPHQEKWLKAKLEILTLQLDEMRPISWFATFVTPTATALATIAVSFVLGAVFLPAMHRFVDVDLKPGLEVFASATIIIVSYPLTATIGNHLTMQWFVVGKLVAERKARLQSFVICWARNCFVFVITLSLIVTVFEKCVQIPQPTDYKLTRTDHVLALSAGLPQIYWFFQCFLPGLAVLIAMGFLGILHLGVVGLRGVTWRIVEFQKGPCAALVAIATLICGIVDIVIRTSR